LRGETSAPRCRRPCPERLGARRSRRKEGTVSGNPRAANGGALGDAGTLEWAENPCGGALVPVSFFLVLSALLFSIGIYGVLARQHAVLVLLSIELMLNAVNINLVAFAAMLGDAGIPGQVFALFVITVAAAEVGVGLAIVILIYRNRQSVDVEEMSLMKW
jgi:NADH:ubiquinone oxidoreductase subunit K